MKPFKALDDFTEDEIIQIFISDCLVPPVDNTVVPDFVIHQLMQVYCKQIGSSTPTKGRLTVMMRKLYTQTKKDEQICYRVAIKPNLIRGE